MNDTPTYHPIAATIVCGHDCPGTPAAKSKHVASLAMAYRDIVDSGETLQTAIIDMIADLLHLADSLTSDERDSINSDPIGESVAESAVRHYIAEPNGDL